MIAMEQLRKQFTSGRGRTAKTVVAVDGMSIHAQDGAITGLLGPNGAGKTTSLRMLVGLVTPDGGSIHVDGIDMRRDPQGVRSRLGVLSDARGLYPRLTARENIVYHGHLHGVPPEAAQARCQHLARLLDMQALLDRRTEGFSQGERMKTALARALVHDPANIVLDEPTNGLDVVATRSLREALRVLRDETGKCIVFSTHIMQEVERLCDRVIVVSHGRHVAEGTVAELCAQAGTADFEDAFVHLAFAPQERGAPA
jgi:sodium transport system ATP-binding protein